MSSIIGFYSGWLTSDWSECLPICGRGRRTRSVYCVHQALNETLNVPEMYCVNQTKPNSEELCASESCGHWLTGQWTKCSATCGQGIRRRTVECVNGNDCTLTSRPISEEICYSGIPCDAHIEGSHPWIQVDNRSVLVFYEICMLFSMTTNLTL
ncbi:thrombospondin type 1 domain protein [Dictyocaulus viviparus]|uniref:Thrombospondin type 1 domain protein n=1 Tax=Dictyocaulus viviparus TaxID=29172 RepID=A0A0D8XKW9_DICVI|nr:thrombospondin type 1 domain protein [Dictyocaulus viviparus]